jgi:phenylalanyl-tRNA synthetase beta chain
MKYSVNLGQYYSKVDLSKILKLSSSELADKLNSQIGAFDEIIDWGARYEGVYVVKIVSARKHPDADKLQVCLIDDGGAAKNVDRDKEGFVQVVCGGPNARKDLITVWVSPGATVPSTFEDREPFVLSKIKLRGVESSGMLATPKELAISNDHEGVIELESPELDKSLLKPGTAFKKLYDLDDIIVDFENKMFTHRPDCFGHLGIAREVAGIQGINFKSPEWYQDIEPNFPKPESKIKLEIINKIPELVPRYTAVCIEGIEIAPSPVWLQSYLTRLGIKPINNVVDITNYMMVLTGQPMHAFDFDKIKQTEGLTKLTIRKPSKGDKLKVLSGKDIDLHEDTITIYKDDLPIDLAGMMGGANSEISDDTTRIILQSASFDMYNIRRTSMRFGVFTEAVTRYTKGQTEAQTAVVLFKAMQMVKELIPDSKSGEVLDLGKTKFESKHLEIKTEKINDILGLNLSREQISKILNFVEIYSHEMLDEVCVTPPFWRTDLEIPEDYIEEIGRLYGFNKIEAELPVRRISPARKIPMIELKKAIRMNLSSHGVSEVLTYNFVNESLLKRAGQDPELAYKIRNALSPDLQRYRLSLIPNLLDKVHMNVKAGQDRFALFELGKCHVKGHLEKSSKLPMEFDRLSFVYTNKNQEDGSPYFVAKRYLENLLSSLGIKCNFLELDDEMFKPKIPVCSPFQLGRSAGIEIDGELRGVIGEFNAEVSKNFKLPEYSAGFELDLGLLSEKFNLDPSYKPLNKFPSISQDITVEVGGKSFYVDVKDKLQKDLERSAKGSNIEFKISPVSIYQKEASSPKNITFNIEFWHPERTLTSKEVSALVG